MQRLKTCRVTHDEEGPVTSREELFLKIRGLDDPGREWLALQVSNQLESNRSYLVSISCLHMVDRGSVIIRRDMHRLILGQPQHQSIVRQCRRDDLGHARKHVPDVEHVRQETEQILRHASHVIVMAESPKLVSGHESLRSTTHGGRVPCNLMTRTMRRFRRVPDGDGQRIAWKDT